jgi:hypothetical protein
MIDRRQFLTMTTSALVALKARRGFASYAPLSGTNPQFVMEAPVGNPFYAWPRTLLSYPVDAAMAVDPQSHRLLCVETNEAVAFQVSKASGSPELIFFGDLPVDAKRTYRLDASPANATVAAPVKITSDSHAYTVDAGPIQIRIPVSQTVSGAAPGPILQVARGGEWHGASTVSFPGQMVASIKTEQTEAGPLRSTHRVTYRFSGGATYIATIQCFAGVDFVRVHEDMEATPADAVGAFDFAWTGCSFQYRQMPNHPWNFPRVAEKYSDYPWEKIGPAFMDTQFGVSPGLDADGQMPAALRTFDPWGDMIAASFANFWGDSTPDAAAIFIDRINDWEDREYAIWHSSARIAVEFVYKQSTLHFSYKIARGTRSSCLVFYDHAKDVAAMARLERVTHGIQYDGARYGTTLFSNSYALELQNWHGTLDLDKTKDWQLTYPEGAAQPKPLFKIASSPSAEAYYQLMAHSQLLTELANSGTRQNHGFGPTSSRQIMENWVPAYQIYRSHYTPAQRRRIEAVLLMIAYVHADEDYMPMQRMLSGHPNFLSDVKSTAPGMAFLFPDHPAADAWAEEYECFLRLNTRYHTRPEVASWNARGGRWTENLGTYVWAFLRPASRAAFVLKARDGHERLCTPQLVQMGDWLVNALSAPFAGESVERWKLIAQESAVNEGARRHYWGAVSPTEGARRIHPPMGAHSERRKPPRVMWYLGTTLKNYNPLVSEHLMWAGRPHDQEMEQTASMADPYDVMTELPDNRGTNPHLRTAKYTGFGITLRAAVDTPQELSVHLIQIDDGPNYRWGDAAEGSCGMIYFYANGKGYSHNGVEDAGDRIDQDTDFGTNFGVWKDKAFRAIGQNVLSRPCYDLTYAQYAELVPREGDRSYSWPEYVGRAVMLAGDDYFVVHDKVFNPEINNRFSWFVRKGDEFPKIQVLTNTRSRESGRFSTVITEQTEGRWFDGVGDSIALITHKDDIHAEPAIFGGRVTVPGGRDLVFASQTPIHFSEGGVAFSGMAGIVRDRNDAWELALFHGTHIAAAGMAFTTPDTELGLSVRSPKSGGPAEGFFYAPEPSRLEIALSGDAAAQAFYIDGAKVEVTRDGGRISVKLPAGEHRWELTAASPMPLAPAIRNTEYASGGATVHGVPVAAATGYTLEISADNAATWQAAGAAATPLFNLTGLTNGKKYHVRMFAKNQDRASAPGPEYPVYVTDAAPPPPDGLHVELAHGSATLTWGEVLGVTEYRVYRRKAGEAQFRVAYTGRETMWKDVDEGIVAPAHSPSNLSSTKFAPTPAFAYYVTARNHSGEGKPSRGANSDPASWRNWNPTDGEPFRRTFYLLEGPLPNDGGGRHYPV